MISELARTARYPGADPAKGALFARVPAVLLVLPILLMLAAGCSQESANKSPSATPTEDQAVPPVVRRPLPATANTAQPESPAMAPLPSAEPAIAVPPGTQYVCVTGAAAERQQTAIEFSPQVAQLCVKNPEMGPCQYERNACRRRGGRVFGADGKEITLATESEYDKKVMRIKLKSN